MVTLQTSHTRGSHALSRGIAISLLQMLTVCGAVHAQEVSQEHPAVALEEVIVTATKEAKNIQDVPLAVSAVTEEQIAAQGLDNILEITRSVPSIQFSGGDAGQRNGANVTIRGIANTRFNDILNDGTAALTTGFYLDEVPVVPVDANLFDVNRVEILKGPQGTLFGQASMGGTVRVILNKPDLKTFSAEAVGDAGL